MTDQQYTPPTGPISPSTVPLPRNLKPTPEVVLLEWSALSRPHKKRKKEYYTTIAIFIFLISLILFFAGQFLPIAVVLSVGFLAYVLEVVPPTNILLKITSYGIRIEEKLYYWDDMQRFWFTEKYGFILLQVEVAYFPNRLTLIVNQEQKSEIEGLLSQVLLMEKPKPTVYEQAAERLQKLIPLE